MRAFLQRLGLVIVGVFAPVIAQAQIEEPEYTGTVFDSVTAVALDGALFFGVIVAICVLVTGFFLGRKWLKRAG